MIQNVDDVVKFLQSNELKYWKVKAKDGDNSLIFESDETRGFADNEKCFRDVMDICPGSRFILVANDKKTNTRGSFSYEFKNIPTNPSVTGALTSPTVQGIGPEEVQKRIDDAITGFKTTLKLEQLQDENKELKQDIKDLQTPLNNVIRQLNPYISTILSSIVSKIIPNAPAIQLAGIEYEQEQTRADETDQETDQPETSTIETPEQQRLIVALEKWSKADPDFITLIESVAELAATNDPIYTIAKNMLLKK